MNDDLVKRVEDIIAIVGRIFPGVTAEDSGDDWNITFTHSNDHVMITKIHAGDWLPQTVARLICHEFIELKV